MTIKKEDLARFIELLSKLKENPDELSWGEICELRDFKYQYSDFIQEMWEHWSE